MQWAREVRGSVKSPFVGGTSMFCCTRGKSMDDGVIPPICQLGIWGIRGIWKLKEDMGCCRDTGAARDI